MQLDLPILQPLELPTRYLPGQTTPTRRRGLSVFHSMAWGTDKNGNVMWVDPWVGNILHDEGELYILSAVFATGMTNYGAALGTLYLGLDARSSLAESDTLASLTGEPSTGGYARKSIATNGTGAGGQPFVIAQPGAYYIATSATQTWTAASGNIGTVKNRFLCTDASATTSGDDDHLIASLALSTDRTINDGDSLNVAIAIGLSE